MDAFEVEFHAWSIKNGLLISFIGENYNARTKAGREEAYKQNPYAVASVAVVKRTAGYTEYQGGWPSANRQHVYFYSQRSEILNPQ